MKKLVIPKGYRSKLNLAETEVAIDRIKHIWNARLRQDLNLIRITGPKIVEKGTGINDDLNGSERPVSFRIAAAGKTVEFVQSLAKYKRLACAEHGFQPGYGLYVDMDAIRADEEALGNDHSGYVDQFDWEAVMRDGDRNLEFLQNTVCKLFNILRVSAEEMARDYARQGIDPALPGEISFVHTEELVRLYPGRTPSERETAIVKEKGAVFIIGIGADLSDTGKPHDGRAPDYDDWVTPTELGPGLNGDLFVWDPVLEKALELSSMGIRVSPETLRQQLKIRGNEDRKNLFYHRLLLEGKLPQTVGGGIGQSRLCRFLLQKAHVGEVQSGIWPDEQVRLLAENDIHMLGSFYNLGKLDA